VNLRERAGTPVGTRGELALYRLSRPTEIRCARCAVSQVTRWLAVLGDNWTALWCKSCFLAMPRHHQAGRPDPATPTGPPYAGD
jgi:hypothetical protein